MANKRKKPAPEKTSKGSLSYYYKVRDRCIALFQCPHCTKTLLAKHYEKHYKVCHDLDPATECAWCDGEFKWKKDQKHKHVDHLVVCFRNFRSEHIIKREPIPEVVVYPTEFTKFNLMNKCEAFDLFGLSKISRLHPNLYKDFLLSPQYPIDLTYQDENLNLAASYVHKFLNNHSYDFFHVMVRAAAMNNFLELLGQTREEGHSEDPVTFLPFSCWCDGGDVEEDYFRQHRHWIAVAPKGTFQSNVWKRFNISAEDRELKGPHYKCKKHKAIEVVMHLVNAMGYLSQRESQCNFSFRKGDEGNDDAISSHQNHYHLSRPLPKDYRFVLVLQWDNGILDLLNQNCKNLDPAKFLHLPLEFRDGKWQIQIKYLPNVPLNLVLPVSKIFRPSEGPTRYYVHLLHGKKFYFEIDTELEKLDDDAWHREQIKMGNAFLFLVGEEYWTLSHYQQKYINDVKPMWDRYEEMNRRIEKLEMENHQLKETLENQKRNCEEKSFASNITHININF